MPLSLSLKDGADNRGPRQSESARHDPERSDKNGGVPQPVSAEPRPAPAKGRAGRENIQHYPLDPSRRPNGLLNAIHGITSSYKEKSPAPVREQGWIDERLLSVHDLALMRRGIDGDPRPLVTGNEQAFTDAGIRELVLLGVTQGKEVR